MVPTTRFLNRFGPFATTGFIIGAFYELRVGVWMGGGMLGATGRVLEGTGGVGMLLGRGGGAKLEGKGGGGMLPEGRGGGRGGADREGGTGGADIVGGVGAVGGT
jgi:hypothetical protein